MAIPINPYRVGDPVGHTDGFIGREDIVARIKEILEDPHSNIMLLYGQRRVGKTSILQYLEKQLINEGPYHPVYFDLHGKSDLPLVQILQELAYTISHKLHLPDPRSELLWETEVSFRETWLSSVLNALPDAGSIVLLLDEFDVLADPKSKASEDSEQSSASNLFKYLKQLAEQHARHLQFIFVIGRHKEDLSIVAQSLFRESPQCLVSLLYRRDVIGLVQLSEKNDTLYWDESAIGRVIQLTNGHPLLTQQLCSQVWEQIYDQDPQETPTATSANVAVVIPEVLQNAHQHLEWLWGSLSAPERVVAAVLAEVGPEPIGQEKLESLLQEKSQLRVVIREVYDALQRLKDHDILEFVSEGLFKFRVELVRQWVLKNKSLNTVQKEVDSIQSIAENLYQAASQFFDENELEQACDLARRAYKKNHYHIGANLLLADILLAQHKINEARELLEQLYEDQPTAASGRLINVYSTLAKYVKGDDNRLDLYRRILDISPSHQETLKKWQEIWKFKAQYAEQVAKTSGKLEDLEAACEAYRKADNEEKTYELEQQVQQKTIINGQQKLEALKQSEQYAQALGLLDKLEQKTPSPLWGKYRSQLTPKAELSRCYQDAVQALTQGKQEQAQTLLVKVVKADPKYKDATLYLHQAVTNTDFSDTLQRLADAQSKCHRIEREAQQVRDEAQNAQDRLADAQADMQQKRAEINRLTQKLNQTEKHVQEEISIRHQCNLKVKIQQKQITELKKKIRRQMQEFDAASQKSSTEIQQQVRQTEAKWREKNQKLYEEMEHIIQEHKKQQNRKEKLEEDLSFLREQNNDRARRVRHLRQKMQYYLIALAVILALFLLCLSYTFVLR